MYLPAEISARRSFARAHRRALLMTERVLIFKKASTSLVEKHALLQSKSARFSELPKMFSTCAFSFVVVVVVFTLNIKH